MERFNIEKCPGDTPVCSGTDCVACVPNSVRCANPKELERCDERGIWSGVTEACPALRPTCAAGRCGAQPSVSAGGAHTCVLLASGVVECWGDDAGVRAVPLAERATQVAAGGTHTCALLASGGVTCWGQNDWGQLGLGDTIGRDPGPDLSSGSRQFVDFNGESPISLALGQRHSCALFSNGAVRCWGANESGQLGMGDTEFRGDEPNELGASLPAVDLGPGVGAVAISCGSRHTCALLTDHRIKCWGANDSGQLGGSLSENRGDAPGEMGDALASVEVDPAFQVDSIAAGANHTCALSTSGAIFCWGPNRVGQLGVTPLFTPPYDSLSQNVTAIDFAGAGPALALSAGASHTCALLVGGELRCWGLNLSGQLGLGNNDFLAVPGKPLVIDRSVDLGTSGYAPISVVDVSAGVDFTCAVLADQRIKCWGVNRRGQLGSAASDPVGDSRSELGDALPDVAMER